MQFFIADFVISGTTITANVVNPGIVRTNLHRHMPFKQSAFVSLAFTPFMWFLMKTSKDGAQTSVYCTISKEEAGVSGKYYSLVANYFACLLYVFIVITFMCGFLQSSSWYSPDVIVTCI